MKNFDVVECRGCLFFKPGQFGTGRCHRYPPQIAFTDSGTVNRSSFPIVNEREGCGEFKPAKGLKCE